jgi:hypothetical protein
MTMQHNHHLGAHLVGSVPMDSAHTVMSQVASTLGPWLHTLPDGETGERINWVECQHDVFRAADSLEPDPDVPGYEHWPSRYRLRDGADPAAVQFGALSYARAAASSFDNFRQLRDAGVIHPTTRFQVSLPTPLAAVKTFASPRDMAALEGPYERTLVAEIADIVATIPHEQLAFQLDVCWEIEIIEGCTPSYWADDIDSVQACTNRVISVASSIPDTVPIGFHLCYGDYGHEHFMQPADTAVMVDLANRITTGLNRPVAWFHMPVPADRDDVAYFEPLRSLIAPERLYLGLVHHNDGVDGARRRSAAAAAVVDRFGIATECGMGRTSPDQVPALLATMRDLLT